MTSKPEALGALGYHWTDYIGTTLSDAVAQWSSSGNPVLISIIGTHWETAGRPLKDHLKHTVSTLATNNSFSSDIPVYTMV